MVLLTFTSTTWSITCVQPFKNKALRPPQPLTSAWMPSLVTWSHQEMFNCSNSGHPSLRTKQNKTNIWLNPIPKAPKSHSIGYLVREWLQSHVLLSEYTDFLNIDLDSQSNNNDNNKVYLSILVVFTWDYTTRRAISNPAKLMHKVEIVFQIR